MKMAKKKAAREKIMATKTSEKGLIIIHTGKGKGKSTAAFGMIFRHIAHGLPSAVVQFIKGGMSTGERRRLHLGNPGQGPRYRDGPGRMGKSEGTDPRREEPHGPSGRNQYRLAL